MKKPQTLCPGRLSRASPAITCKWYPETTSLTSPVDGLLDIKLPEVDALGAVSRRGNVNYRQPITFQRERHNLPNCG